MRFLRLAAIALLGLCCVSSVQAQAFRVGTGIQVRPKNSRPTTLTGNGTLWSDSTAADALKWTSPAGATSTLSTASGYATIMDEGGALTQRLTVNFIGAGISCVDNSGATRTDCTISSGGGSTGNWTFSGDAADDSGAAVLTIGATTATGITLSRSAGTVTIAGAMAYSANKGVTVAAGTSAFDFSGGSGVFKTSTGASTFGGSTNTFSSGAIGPASGQQHTLPAVTSDTFALLAASQTLTNKSISGATNTLSAIAESSVTNLTSDLAAKAATATTISTTSPLGGGGDLSANRTLTCTTCITGTPSATGDLLYSTAGGQGQTVLAAGAAGKFLRFAGVGAAPVVSTLVLPNAATTNQVLYASGTDTIGASATLAGLTLTAPVINGATSASGNFDLSGSSGTTKTTTGTTTLSGPVSIASGIDIVAVGGVSDLDMSNSTGFFWTGSGAVNLAGNISIRSNVDMVTVAGTSKVDFSAGSGLFKTTTGANTFGGSSNTFTNNVLPSVDNSPWLGDSTHRWIIKGSQIVGQGSASQTNAIGTTDGIIVVNNSQSAGNGSQRYSPPVSWQGAGYASGGGGGSTYTEIVAQLIPVQGVSNPSVGLSFQSKIGAAGFTESLNIGNLLTTTSVPIVGNLGATAYTQPWTAITYATGCADAGGAYSGSAYYKDAMAIVHVRVAAVCATGTPTTAINTALPAGYRPIGQLITNAYIDNLSTHWVIMTTGGIIKTDSGGTTNVYVEFSYPAEQ